MSAHAAELAALVVALFAACWAGLLALAQESPSVSRTLGDGTAPKDRREPGGFFRVIHVGRLSLLLFAGGAAAMAVGWWERQSTEAAVVAVVVVGFLYMVAEALPRAVGTLAPDVAASAAPVAGRSIAPFRPLFLLATAFERLLQRTFPQRGEHGASSGSVRRDLLLGVFSLKDTAVGEIMTPRLDIMALESKSDWADAVDVVRRSEHARIPVYEGTLDDINGKLFAKDLVGVVAGISPPPDRWQDLLRAPQFVPEAKSLDAQLRDFQRGPAHLAIVVDEFGGTSGVVTLEDVLEEVVGEIHDEYDVDDEPAVEREGEDKFWVDGSLTLDELSALLGLAVARDDVSTVGGLVYSELGHVPRPGEEFRFAQFRVVVEQVHRRRVRRVYFEGAPDGATADAAPEASS